MLISEVPVDPDRLGPERTVRPGADAECRRWVDRVDRDVKKRMRSQRTQIGQRAADVGDVTPSMKVCPSPTPKPKHAVAVQRRRQGRHRSVPCPSKCGRPAAFNPSRAEVAHLEAS